MSSTVSLSNDKTATQLKTIRTQMRHEIKIDSLDDIREAARKFVSHMDSHTVFAFYGKMGAGKTTFIKAVCEEMGVNDVITSPTFAIVNEYETADGESIYHFDLYRIKRIDELYDMGYEDYFYSGSTCFIEWPEMAEDLLPDDAVSVSVEEQPDGSRTISW